MPRAKPKTLTHVELFTGKHAAVVASWIIGCGILLLLIVILFLLPNPTFPQRVIIRFLLALCAGFMAYFFVGRVLLKGAFHGMAISATGGFALFAILQFVVDPFAATTSVADSIPELVVPNQDIREVQQGLQKLKYYDGEINGVRDSKTAEAIKHFQTDSGLKADGYAGQETTRKLQIRTPNDESAHVEVGENGWFKYTDGWDEKHLAKVAIPQLVGVKGFPESGYILFHRDASSALQKAFEELEELGFIEDFKSWDGSYAPRLIRGSLKQPSSHAFGIAFDVNANFNPLGSRRSENEAGSLHRVAPVLKKHGFLWGGEFKFPDAMHFQWQPIKPL